MTWWVLVCSLMIVGGVLLQIGAPVGPVAAGLIVGCAMVWWRNHARGASK